MPCLGMNIDHVATLRQARYPSGGGAGASAPAMSEPDVVRAMHESELGGASCITMHLREDRRHVVDRDIERVREATRVKFNLEMAATDEMVAIAERVRPHMVTLVPEGRMEVTTEGGLDVAQQQGRLGEVVSRLVDAGASVSAFVDPECGQIAAAGASGFAWVELHTGPYAHAWFDAGGDERDDRLARELERLRDAASAARVAGVGLNAGHALNYDNVGPVARLDGVRELHIGHSIVARAVFAGLREAVAGMVARLAVG
ncbi:MAG: pyridoxine 5'-phosphate synthase [Planctomycetota bacterium]